MVLRHFDAAILLSGQRSSRKIWINDPENTNLKNF